MILRVYTNYEPPPLLRLPPQGSGRRPSTLMWVEWVRCGKDAFLPDPGPVGTGRGQPSRTSLWQPDAHVFLQGVPRPVMEFPWVGRKSVWNRQEETAVEERHITFSEEKGEEESLLPRPLPPAPLSGETPSTYPTPTTQITMSSPASGQWRGPSAVAVWIIVLVGPGGCPFFSLFFVPHRC